MAIAQRCVLAGGALRHAATEATHHSRLSPHRPRRRCLRVVAQPHHCAMPSSVSGAGGCLSGVRPTCQQLPKRNAVGSMHRSRCSSRCVAGRMCGAATHLPIISCCCTCSSWGLCFPKHASQSRSGWHSAALCREGCKRRRSLCSQPATFLACDRLIAPRTQPLAQRCSPKTLDAVCVSGSHKSL